MKRSLGAFALAVALCGCAAQDQALSSTHAAAIQDSVRATLDAFRRYSAKAQWDSLGMLYADDSAFRWIEDGTVRVHSAAQIRKTMSSLPAGTHFEHVYDSTEVTPLAPGVASVLTRFHTTIFDPSGKSFGFGGVMTMTMVHRGERWLVLNGHASAPSGRVPPRT